MAPDKTNNHKNNSSDNETSFIEDDQFFENSIDSQGESEEETENDSNNYQLLHDYYEFDSDKHEFEEISPTFMTHPTFISPFECSGFEVNFKMHENSFQMDQERINEIKTAMSGFALPSSSIPSWASIISEDEWKSFIKNRNLIFE